MASIYTHKDSNIRKTWLLFTAFFVVVIAIGLGFAQIYNNSGILVIAVVFSTLMSVVSYWYSDKIVLAMTRAVPVTAISHPELYRIVENLTIAAGLTLPKIYVVPEKQPNAFATGRNLKHAVVAVTAGLLERLNKTELEGVLAHELSHIGNRDMLVSTAAVVLVGFISLLADFFMRSLWWRGFSSNDDREGGNAANLLLLVGVVLSILAPLAATLMQFAISRRREMLADASGALLTRYPEGLASALEKISSDHTPMRVASNAMSHLWFDDPYDNKKGTPFLHKLFMTHPPVEERIKALREMSV